MWYPILISVSVKKDLIKEITYSLHLKVTNNYLFNYWIYGKRYTETIKDICNKMLTKQKSFQIICILKKKLFFKNIKSTKKTTFAAHLSTPAQLKQAPPVHGKHVLPYFFWKVFLQKKARIMMKKKTRRTTPKRGGPHVPLNWFRKVFARVAAAAPVINPVHIHVFNVAPSLQPQSTGCWISHCVAWSAFYLCCCCWSGCLKTVLFRNLADMVAAARPSNFAVI